MSKQNNLTDFLTDVANAIRAKKGSTDLINPQNFSAEIASLSGGLEVIDMTETTATIEPNKVYVWGMVASLDITLGASTDESDFFAFRFRCSKPTMTSLIVNGATWADDTELDAQGKPVLDLGSWYQCEIKGGTSALYARLAHYIPFADSNVEAVLLAKGVGDGLGVTYKDAAKVKSISTWFKGNADITAFSEFVNFSGISQLIEYAFQNCTSLAEITLPASLTSIGRYAFHGCTSLAEITLPTGLTSIGVSAFERCTSLRSRVLPEGLTTISQGAFVRCSALSLVIDLPNLTTLGKDAFSLADVTRVENLGKISSIEHAVSGNYGMFRGNVNLTYVNLPDTLTSIGNYAFYGCTSLPEITLPTGLTSIGNDTFNGCSSLPEITLPDTLTSIGNSTFNSCSLLTRVINLENTKVTSIGNDTFNGCSSLTGITLPATLTSIGRYAFHGCTSLAEITLPASLTSIGNYAFKDSKISGEYTFESLTTIGACAFRGTNVSKMRFPSLVSLPDYVNYEGIFSYCPNLILVEIGENCTSIGSNSLGRYVGTSGNDITFIMRATTPPTLTDRLILTQWVKAKIGVIYVPDESLETYKTATNWSYYADIIKPLSEYTE